MSNLIPAKPLPSYGEKLVSAIGPGDFVECLRGGTHSEYPCGPALAVAAVYQVRDAGDGPDRAGREIAGVALVSIVMPIGPHGVEAMWSANRFRLLYQPKSELITDLLKSVDEPIREGVDA